MRIQEAIERANEMRQGNASSDEAKVRWLDELDKMIYNDVITRHEGNENVQRPEYSADNTDVELLAQGPYDVLYVYYLMAQIDLAASEINKYNASVQLYNSAMHSFKCEYRRTHKTKKTRPIRVGGMV